MPSQVAAASDVSASPAATPDARDLIRAAAALMIAAQLAFRAWALYPSWFYTDDYRFLHDAGGRSLTWGYLAQPFDSQFMPAGRAIAWFVARAGHMDWATAASLTLVLQLLASVACLLMLLTLFGHRWAVLGLLGLYLTSAVTLPALMWWAASLNQLPLQIVLFGSVAAWVQHLRTRRLGWLAATLLLVGIGLLSYVKTALVLGVLAYLLLAYFATGNPWTRTMSALRRYWMAGLSAAALSVGFAGYYLQQVPQVFAGSERPVAGDLAREMIATSLTTGVLGGPWRWDTSNPPVGRADPPGWSVLLAVLALVLLGVGLALFRRRTGRAWVLLGGYVGAVYLLVLTSRAQVIGSVIGLEYRYLTDVLPVVVLCLGLAGMRLTGAQQSSTVRELDSRPRGLRWPPPPRWRLVAAMALVAVFGSGLASSWRYVEIWHHDNPGAEYLANARAGLTNQGTVDLADQVLPAEVVPGISAPANTTARLLPLAFGNVRFPDISSRLVVLDSTGTPHRVDIDPAVSSPAGPEPGCGWRVDGAATTVTLDGTAFDFTWWVKIGYLGSQEDEIEIRAGETSVRAPVLRGLNSLYVRVSGQVSEVTFSGLAPDSSLCVDTIDVGRPIPGSEL